MFGTKLLANCKHTPRLSDKDITAVLFHVMTTKGSFQIKRDRAYSSN